MVEQRQDGFTIIEVLMFLAISGLLLFGAMASLGGTIGNTRFNDAINTTVSYFQKQYTEVSSGRNARDATLGCSNGNVDNGNESVGSTKCVVLGRLLQFITGTNIVTTRYIVGVDTTNSSAGDSAAVVAALPKATVGNTNLEDDFNVPWSVSFNKATQGAAAVNSLAIIRSPISERILFYSFQAPANINNLTSSEIKDANLNKPIDICLRDDNTFKPRVGYIKIGSGQGQDIIRADLSSVAGTCA